MRYYLDCEFDGYRGPLISIALVRYDGESIYLVVNDAAADPWVRDNVIPVLLADRMAHPDTAPMKIADFLRGDPDPLIIADWPADIRYLCDLIEFPGGEMATIPKLKFAMERVDAYPTTLPGAVQHNAWWDAMALRHLLEPT